MKKTTGFALAACVLLGGYVSSISVSRAEDWPMWGRTPNRNMVTPEAGVPTDWDVETGKNIKWVASLGSQTYGNPVVASGKVFIGTNNGNGYLKRYPADVDLGVLVCFNEADGKFLWQHSSEKLPTGRVHDWPLLGLCGSALVEGNRVEDNARNGIFYEASNGSTIRNNTVRRSGDTGIFISTSQNAQIYSNTVEDNFRAITYFVNCGGMVGRDIDLQNNWAYDNSIRVGTQSGAFATGMSYTGDCSSTQVNTYFSGSKNLRFSHNTYDVPDAGGWYWLWNGMKQWFQWQGIPQDLDGTVQ